MRRLRVLSIINALHFGGDQSRLLSLSASIDRERFDHTVLTFKKPCAESEAAFGSCRPEFEAAGIDLLDLGDESPGLGRSTGSVGKFAKSVPRLTGVLRRLVQFVRRHHIDVIDAHVGTANQLGAAASLLTGVPAVLTTYELEQFSPEWLYESTIRLCLRVAAAVMTDSDPVAATIRSKVRATTPVLVIPNGIDPPLSTRSVAQMRAALGIPNDPQLRVVGQVGSLSRRKGHVTLLDTALEVVRREPHVHFLCCGYIRADGYADELRARASALGIADRVTFVSYPGPIGDVYRAIDVQVHASTAESLPQAIIEGMSLGKPAVVTAVAGIPSLVLDAETGIVVPAGDPAALASGLLRILRDDALAKRLGTAAQARYQAAYTRELMTRAIENVFLDVARSRGKVAG